MKQWHPFLEHVLLLYPPGPEFITAFLGCLYAGVVAVPAYLPRGNRNLSRLQAIAANAEVAVALTTGSVLADMPRRVNQDITLASWQLLPTDNLSTALAQQWRKPALENSHPAFLQYTSGSTGNPKGVMVSHSNVLHNQRLIKDLFGHTHHSIGVGWLPYSRQARPAGSHLCYRRALYWRHSGSTLLPQSSRADRSCPLRLSAAADTGPDSSFQGNG